MRLFLFTSEPPQYVKMCIRDSNYCEHKKLHVYRHGQPNCHVFIHCVRPVSYTHLDVYKRQAYTKEWFDATEKIYDHQKEMAEEARDNALDELDMLDFHYDMGLLTERDYYCLLYTSRCV